MELHFSNLVRLPIELDPVHAALIVEIADELITRMIHMMGNDFSKMNLLSMGDRIPVMGMMMYMTTLVFHDSIMPFRAAIATAIEIGIHSRSAINN